MNILKSDKFQMIGSFILIVGICGFFSYQNRELSMEFDENGVLILPEKNIFESYKSHMGNLLVLTEQYQEAYYADDFGGTNPQETLDLFVEALEKGDTELASRYFVVNKQKQTAKELSIGKENGVLELLIGDLKKEKYGAEISKDKYRFSTYDKDNVAEFSFDLVLNEEKNIWKIESL